MRIRNLEPPRIVELDRLVGLSYFYFRTSRKLSRRMRVKLAKKARRHQGWARLTMKQWPAIESIWEMLDIIEESHADITDPARILKRAK